MTILPAVPAGRLAPVGHAIPAREIRELVEATAEASFVEAVAMQLSVAVDVFEAIRDGHKDPVGLAIAALTVLKPAPVAE